VVELAEAYTAPLYTQAEAARIVDVPSNTFRNWSRGYAWKTVTGTKTAEGLITLAPNFGRLVVPFVGLAEAYVIASLKQAGLPMQRIRPAVEGLKAEMGLSEALLSSRLQTDGVEVLYEYVAEDLEDGAAGLAVVRDKQLVFRDAVAQYLKTVSYSGDGLIESFMPRQYHSTVIVDPLLNGGQPSFVVSGVRVEDIARRVRAGEPMADLAEDYDIPVRDIETVLGRD
jgi:uncharacterized protein (DUF433 family)